MRFVVKEQSTNIESTEKRPRFVATDPEGNTLIVTSNHAIGSV